MRLHTLRHVAYEGLGYVGSWARAAGIRVTQTRVWLAEPAPDPDEYDWLVVLGGPMGVCDAVRTPWLAEELRYLEQVVARATPVLGICLGAQMLASVLGARVRRHRHPEIGWHRVRPAEPGGGQELTEFFGPEVEVMQWHYDTFDLPAGARHLARSDACENQAFAWGDHVLAVQFHPEMTEREVAAVIERDGPLPAGEFVTAPERMLVPERFARLREATHRFLDTVAPGLDPTRCP